MTENSYLSQFIQSAQRVGAEVVELENIDAVAGYVVSNSTGKVLVPLTPLSSKHKLREILAKTGSDVHVGKSRDAGKFPGGGVTFCNFGMADTGTVVLESTDEEIRLASTLPEIHFVIIDPRKILKDNLAAVPPMTEMHSGKEPRFVAYITGPSRTADIERVLTIGCHGPRQLHILVVESVSSDVMEM